MAGHMLVGPWHKRSQAESILTRNQTFAVKSKQLGSFDDSQQKKQSQYTAVHASILIRTFR